MPALNMPFRVAMVGPRPPERSGIAEYSAGLVDMLRDHGIRVETVTSSDVERDGAHAVVDMLLNCDAVVYQVGNHVAFHGWMLPLMQRVPGIVHLHDLVLHLMFVGLLDAEGRLQGDDYAGVLGQWHSAAQVKEAESAFRRRSPVWNRDEIVEFPLHQIATKFATAVVVHSEYSASCISREFPWLPVTVLPQLYPVTSRYRVRERLGTIAIMGGGVLNRRFDWVVEALSLLDPALDGPITLEIAGELEPAVQQQLDGLAGLSKVHLINHGHVDSEQFAAIFERADLMVALRQPTMGEASAVVCKALQAGLPTIVSDHGWYAELPPCVKKVAPTDDCPEVLAGILRELAADADCYARWAEACGDQAVAPELDPFIVAEQYATLLRSSSVYSDFRDKVATALASLKVDVDSPLFGEVQRIDVRSTLRGDHWTSRALAALSERELDSHARTIGPKVGPYPYSEPLPEDAFQGRVAVVGQGMGAVQPSSMISLRIEMTNNSPHPWLSPSGQSPQPYGIYVGHFWLSSDPGQLPGEQPRQWIEDVISPSSSGEQVITVRAPEMPGEYHLEIDILQESVCWFKSRGFVPARLVVQVEAARP